MYHRSPLHVFYGLTQHLLRKQVKVVGEDVLVQPKAAWHRRCHQCNRQELSLREATMREDSDGFVRLLGH